MMGDAAQAAPSVTSSDSCLVDMTTVQKSNHDWACSRARPGEKERREPREGMRASALDCDLVADGPHEVGLSLTHVGARGEAETLDSGSMQLVAAEGEWKVVTRERRGRLPREGGRLRPMNGPLIDDGPDGEGVSDMIDTRVNHYYPSPLPRRRVADAEKPANPFAVLEVEDPPHPADSEISSEEVLEKPPAYVKRRTKKASGKLVSHVRFLQHAFRRSVGVRPGCWRRGGMVGLAWWRPVTVFACRGGRMLASEVAFEAQRDRAARVLRWYSKYTALLRRVESGRTPVALVTFCKQGGVTEGIRRAHGASHGQDLYDQPKYVERFGSEAFTRGDSTSPHEMRALKRKTRAFFTMASPPCKAYSTSLQRGVPSEGPLIEQTRSALEEVGGMYTIENVVGAGGAMKTGSVMLRGSFFGEHVDRPRLFESNWNLHLDRALTEGGSELRRGCCLGYRRRWRRMDPFGRPEMRDCCLTPNLWSVQGDKPLRCTACECAAAMSIDRDHMDYDGLSQAIPPSYAQLIFGQACMRRLEQVYGLRAITYDEMEANPDASRRYLDHWRRGAGGDDASQGVELQEVSSSDRRGGPDAAVNGLLEVEPPPKPTAPAYRPVFTDGSEDEAAPATESTVMEAELRELWYSWAGDYDAVVGPAKVRDALCQLRGVGHADSLRGASLGGQNTLVMVGREPTILLAQDVAAGALREGTRLTVESRCWETSRRLRAAGFRLVRQVEAGDASYATETAPARLAQRRSYWAWGVESMPGSPFDYDRAEAFMDPRDRQGAEKEPAAAKAARSYAPIPWEPARWDIGLPDELREMMAGQGVGIDVEVEPGGSEVPFYKFPSQEALLKSIVEADRALVAGAMEYIPDDHIGEVIEKATVHPWTIVDQGGGKWRLCHDYSVGTNRVVPSAPFSMTSVWDVAPTLNESSHFAKYDIRDGFWHCPVALESRKRLVVRHPGTGRLMWATRLPFGYIDSPRLFCGLTEAVVARLRKQVVGKGVHYYVFVDDILCVGDTEELTREGCRVLEAEFKELGVQWAPNKTRGPCQCIEFLGLLLSNVEGQRGVTITRKRLVNTLSELADWAALRPESGRLEVDPRELASLLGKLIFVSQVVRGGRTYMQGMLSSFKGLSVDWSRGKVTPDGKSWRRMHVEDGFWRDLGWWQRHLPTRSLASFTSAPRLGEAVLTGTDASGWGTGQVAWLHGAREEVVLRFTWAEKRRPINWRELLGILRVGEQFGPRLRGKTVLVETDNMAAMFAVKKMASKAADMQELVRRLLKLSEKHDFHVKVTHTPGEKLDRPDQTSRGDAAEEPRARLSESLFSKVEARWGPFTSMLGAEREHARRGGEDAVGTRIWAHPTFNTVGTALRRIGERLAARGGTTVKALAMVPDDGTAAWNSLLKHGLTVGRFKSGDTGLEKSTGAHWAPCRFGRPMRLVLFPRAAGALAKRIELKYREGISDAGGRAAAAGYALKADGSGFVLGVLPGSWIYSAPKGESVRGCLCRVVVPTSRELGDDPDVLVVQEALLVSSKAAKSSSSLPLFDLSFSSVRTRVDPTEHWTVDHLVVGVGGGKTFDRVGFDVERANRELEQARVREESLGAVEGQQGWIFLSPTDGMGEACTPLQYEPFAASPPSGQSEAAEADEIGDELARMHLEQHPSKSGSEGRIAAPAAPIGEPLATEGSRLGVDTQPCQYAEMACAGCHIRFKLGEPMRSHKEALVHNRDFCVALHDAEIVARAEAALNETTKYYGVYSELPGTSGVYKQWADVARILDSTGARAHHTCYEAADGMLGAELFVTRRRAERAAEIAAEESARAKGEAPRPLAGSLTKQVHLAEKLSVPRLQMIRDCIAGTCGHGAMAGTQAGRWGATPCRGGCGRDLHMVSCAQLGKGYQALGNFTCVSCRLEKQAPGASVNPSQLAVTTTEQTMVLELTQGREATASGYADFAALEEQYAMGMGIVLANGGLSLPRHNSETMKNFISWMTLCKHRVRSLPGVFRGAGAFLAKLEVFNPCNDKSVQAHLKEVLDECGVEAEPATTATPRMLSLMTEEGGIVDEDVKDHFMACRDKVQYEGEGVGGCRVGEVSGAGDCHGLLANNSCILINPNLPEGAPGSVVVEYKLEHSKTGFSRYLDLAGTTETSHIKVADHLREYWHMAGFKVTEKTQAGITVLRPSFYVARLSLLGVKETEPLEEAIDKCPLWPVRKESKTTKNYIHMRYKMRGINSQSKKHVHVAGGSSEEELRSVQGYFQDLGYEVSIVEGPLLLATASAGKKRVPTLMPLSTSSAFAPTKAALDRAYIRANADPQDPDPDLDLAPGVAPKWSTHSLRRLADTTARRYREETETSESEIDLYFGWNERLLKKAMQVHYASLSILERMGLSRITGKM